MELENTENLSEEARAAEAHPESPDELNEPRWSVVSFEKCAAANLTYEQATEKLAELAAEKISGLCIVTDEAASRIDVAEERRANKGAEAA